MTSPIPGKVGITEICPRDGFQNIKEWIPTELKIQVIDLLIDSGLRNFEITSFVSPKAIPQMADAASIAAHVLQRIEKEKLPLDAVALTPNLRGATTAWEAGIRHISYVISASAAHNKANINRTHEESFNDLAAITATYPQMHVTLSMSTVFGCPFDGGVPVKQVLWVLEQALARGVRDVTLCDTIGVASPFQTGEILDAIAREFPKLDIALHMHDTHGMALANILVGLQHGVTRFETAAGGLGGCPFAPGAAGNAATEDVVNMMHRMGIETGVDLEKELKASALIREHIQRNLMSHLAGSRSYAEHTFWQRTKG